MAQAPQILLSKINGEARHKLDLARSTISEFPDMKFGPWWLGWLGFLFLQPKSYIRLILKVFIHKNRDLELIYFVRSYCVLCALGFCNQVLHDLHRLLSEELCSQQQSIKLLELVMDWRFIKQRKECYYNIKFN